MRVFKTKFIKELVIALCLLGMINIHPASCHLPDQVDHLLKVSFAEDTGIQLEYILSYGEILGYILRQQMDSNDDRLISSFEKEKYLQVCNENLLTGLSIEIDGEKLPLNTVNMRIHLQRDKVYPQIFWMSLLYTSDFQFRADTSYAIHIYDANHQDILGLLDIVVAGGSYNVSDVQRIDQAEILRGTRFNLHWTAQPGTETEALHLSTISDQKNFAAETQDQNEAETLQGIIEQDELSPKLVLIALFLAIGLGSIHALSPGHGKTIVAAYLVGSKGRIQDAVFLGIVVTITHVSSVLLLGVLTLFASEYILPQQLYPWIGFASGMLICCIGFFMFRKRTRTHAMTHDALHHHHHHHEHTPHTSWWKRIFQHQHVHIPYNTDVSDQQRSHTNRGLHAHDHHDHSHQHISPTAKREGVSMWSLLGLGISGGMMPCPSALVVLLTAISLHRVVLGLLLIIAFSIGLAIVLITIGILMVTATSFIKKFTGSREASLFKGLSIASSILIMAVGMGIALNSLRQAGVLVINM